MKHCLPIFAAIPLLALGCSEGTTEPAAGGAWDLVRLHEEGDSGYRDLIVESSGTLVLEGGVRGGASPSRGLLAGERLETLARLIDDLPLDTYRSPGSCPESESFLSVTRDGEVLTFRAHDCDDQAPAALETLRDLLGSVAEEIDHPRRIDPDAVRVLASGTHSAIAAPRRLVIEDRDGLARLLRAHDPNGLVAIPRVDFRREVVVALFLGSRPSGGFALKLDSVESNESGWVTVRTLETVPGESCVVSAGVTQPFLIVAVRRPGGGLIFDPRTEEIRCG